VASIRSGPSPCLCKSCPSARQHNTPVFYLRPGWVSKSHTSELLILWERVPCCAVASAGLSQKTVTNLHSGSEFMVKCSKKQHQGLLPSASVCIPMLVNRDAHWCCQFFCPREQPSTIPKCTPKRGTVFPCVTQGILRPHCLLPGLCIPSPPEHR